MFTIVQAEFIAAGIKRLVIEAPRVARKHKAGQFLILRIYEQGERISLTIVRSDPARGNISIVVQAVGKTTHLLNSLQPGDDILEVVGPLGKPSEIALFADVAAFGGGVGVAMAYPTAAALKPAGNRVICLPGVRSRELVILEREMLQVSDRVMVTTDDGSYGDKGLGTDKLRQLLEACDHLNRVVAIGPIPMLRAVADITRKQNILTIVSLNPIMIDGTGMWGAAECSWMARVDSREGQ